MSHTVLILGVRGRLGHALGLAFAKQGWRVLGHTRGPLPPDLLAAGVQPITVPLEQPAALARAALGAQVVVHAINPPYTRWATEARPGLQHGMAVAEHLHALLMFPGNVYAYGAQMPPLLRPDTPVQPSTRKGAIRAEMESLLAQQASLRSVLICAGDFYGAPEGTWLDLAIAKHWRQGKLVYPGPLDKAHAWAYLPDLAQAFVAAAQHALARPHTGLQRWHFAGHTLTGQGLLGALQRAAATLGVTPAQGWKVGGMPWPLLRWGGLLVPMWREVAEMAYLWEVPHALDGQAMQEALSLPPATPVEEAMVAALQRIP